MKGLDHHFEEKLKLVAKNVKKYTSDEMFDELLGLMTSAAHEAGFSIEVNCSFNYLTTNKE